MSARTSRSEQHGFTTVQYVCAVALSMLLLVLVANLLVDSYAQGAIRDALSEGVRAGAPSVDAAGACRARAEEVLHGLLRGPIGDDIDVSCAREGKLVVARAEGRLPSWLPMLVPGWPVSLEASMRTDL